MSMFSLVSFGSSLAQCESHFFQVTPKVIHLYHEAAEAGLYLHYWHRYLKMLVFLAGSNRERPLTLDCDRYEVLVEIMTCNIKEKVLCL